MIPSYSEIFNLGHKAILSILENEVLVEEKLDGSQLSFAKINGRLEMRSKGAEIYVDNPDKMFALGVSYIKSIEDALEEGWIYRGEYLQRAKHNALSYDRTPYHNIIIFDIETPDRWLSYYDKRDCAASLELETVPLLWQGYVKSMDQIKSFLDRTSVLGGQKIEGVVLKPINYNVYGENRKLLMAKYVSEAFKEVHAESWKTSNPGQGDVLAKLVGMLKTEARWNKAIIHLEEQGKLERDPRDIGNLMKEVQEDIKKECLDIIGEELMKWALPKVLRRVTAGLPEWYKQKLVKENFEQLEKESANL
jgi:hypothetical protein